MNTFLTKAVKDYASNHTDYHERSCGNWNEERLYEEIRKAFRAGYKFAINNQATIELVGHTPLVLPGSNPRPKAPRGGTGAI